MDRPERTFGSNVAVWLNLPYKAGGKPTRTISITPRRYKDDAGNWQDAKGWNVSDVAHLSHCLLLALDHCLTQRSDEEAPQ